MAFSISSNRVSFALGLTGPSMSVDTACSSAMVSFDVGLGHLRSGVSDGAVTMVQ